jgi:hypothetical protein
MDKGRRALLRATAIAPLLPVLTRGFLAPFADAQTVAPEAVPVVGPRPFIDYFTSTPIVSPLRGDVWGAAEVGSRDVANGLEDASMTRWNYWDGQILKGSDGRYRMYASRWDQALGHSEWGKSQAVLAVSDTLWGPYRDKGLMWPDDRGGLGHNVIALRMADDRFAVVVSETRNGDIFVSDTADGPWRNIGSIEVDQSVFKSVKTPGDLQETSELRPWKASNVSLILRPDGAYQIIQRSGQMLLSRNGILGPYKVMGDSIYRGLAGVPQRDMRAYEDPVLWYSGGWYHVIVNHWRERRAYHMISRDGLTGWRVQGLAYEPGADFIRYAGGQVNHWNKLERPAVVMEGSHVVALTFAVIDTPKEAQTGNNGHGSKIIVVPFDGAAMDRDLANVDRPASEGAT